MSRVKVIGRHEQKEVLQATLQCGQHEVAVMNYGCVIRDWRLQCRNEVRPIVLGFDRFEPYPEHSPSFGIIAGRVANRTSAGQFELDGQRYQLDLNNGENHLHGGGQGLGKRLWDIEVDSRGNAVRLTYRSVDKEQGYPGNINFSVDFTLDENGLQCEMLAEPDRRTPVNLAQHNYYNLDAVPREQTGNILQHTLMVDSDSYLPVDEQLMPSGEVLDSADSRFDFRDGKTIAASDPEGIGHDHNLLLRADRSLTGSAASLLSSCRQVRLDVISDQPGLQLYTGSKLDVAVAGHDGRRYDAFAGICLEAQHYPDSLNHSQWPSIICSPDSPYRQSLGLKVTQGEGLLHNDKG